jgi:hypothetical protein
VTHYTSRAQLASDGEAQDLAQLISHLQDNDNYHLRKLGPVNLGTARNLLSRARRSITPVEVATFLCRAGEHRSSWTNWGVVVTAVGEDLIPYLFTTGLLGVLRIRGRSRQSPVALAHAPDPDETVQRCIPGGDLRTCR